MKYLYLSSENKLSSHFDVSIKAAIQSECQDIVHEASLIWWLIIIIELVKLEKESFDLKVLAQLQ